MSISLSKGGNISLSKEVPALSKISVGLGWDPKVTDGRDFDLDASAFVLNAAGRAISDKHFVFYNNLSSPDGSVEHTGDEKVGGTGGDDETVKVDLRQVPAGVDKIVFCVSIYEAELRGQSFGQVSNAHIRVVNQLDDNELARYDLTEDASNETAMIFGELYRYGGEWKFRAVGQGFAGGLGPLAQSYGVNV